MKDILPYLDDLPIRILAITPLFALFFAGVFCWVFRRGTKKQYEEISLLPLDD